MEIAEDRLCATCRRPMDVNCCSFCGRDDVPTVQGPLVCICEECTQFALRWFKDQRKLAGFRVNMELTELNEPTEKVCVVCGNNKNFFLYENENQSLFIVGCCLCNSYGDPQSNPLDAAKDWVEKWTV